MAALLLERPLDLAATAGGLRFGYRDPTARVDEREVWWATRTPAGPGTLHLWRSGDEIRFEAWGDGAGWLEAGVPALLGEEDDLTGFAPADEAVRLAWHRHPGLRIGRSGVVLPSLVAGVLGQRVTSEEAMRAWGRLCRQLGDVAPGPGGLRLPPDPDRLAAQPSWWYHRLGVERHRADTLRRVGRHAARMEEAATMAAAEACLRLQAVAGVGPWTAAKVTGVALGDPDAVPVGDYHLPSMVAWALACEPRATDARMLELLEPYAGHRGRVLRLLLTDGVTPPRFGPGRRILPIAHW